MKDFKIIDQKQTRLKGKEVCESFIPALRLKKIEISRLYHPSTSVITVTSDTKNANRIEKMYIDLASNNEHDYATQFFKITRVMGLIDADYETFLIQKYYYEKSDTEIRDTFFCGSTRRYNQVRNHAHELVAHHTHNCVYKNKP